MNNKQYEIDTKGNVICVNEMENVDHNFNQIDQSNEKKEKHEAITGVEEPADHILQILEKKVNENEGTEKMSGKDKTKNSSKNELTFAASSEFSCTDDIQQQKLEKPVPKPPVIDDLEKISNNDSFFHSPLKSILSYISTIDFSSIHVGDRFEFLKNIITNTISAHSKEKKTLLILQNINISQFNLSIERILSIFQLFANCPILKLFCNLYEKREILPEKDYTFDLEQKDKEIDKLKQIIKILKPITKKPKDFESDIFEACKEGKLSSVQWLIEKEIVDKNKRVEEDYFNNDLYKDDTPIHIASMKGHLPIVQYLIEKYDVDINIKGCKRKTPLHYACQEGHLQIIEYLISKGADVYAKDQFGNYVIYYSYLKGYFSIIKYLIEKRHIENEVKNYYSQTPLHCACYFGDLQIVEYLISKGADLYAKDNDENIVIHYSSIGGHLPIVQYLIEKQNVDINIKGWNGKTPLHLACLEGHHNIAEYLISKGANINAKDTIGDYAIHYASKGGHLPIVQYFIEQQNVDIDIKGSNEMTPLHLACLRGHLQIVQYLISKGANIEAKDQFGVNPLCMYKKLFFNCSIFNRKTKC